MKLTAALEQEQEANQKRLHDLAVMQSRADAQESEVRTFIKEIRRYATIEELDEAVLNRLISRIPVSYTHLYNAMEYEFEIDASNGKILSRDAESIYD